MEEIEHEFIESMGANILGCDGAFMAVHITNSIVSINCSLRYWTTRVFLFDSY